MDNRSQKRWLWRSESMHACSLASSCHLSILQCCASNLNGRVMTATARQTTFPVNASVQTNAMPFCCQLQRNQMHQPHVSRSRYSMMTVKNSPLFSLFPELQHHLSLPCYNSPDHKEASTQPARSRQLDNVSLLLLLQQCLGCQVSEHYGRI